uniref:Clan AA aspartic protease, AF_0612 family n=1 Tax=Candidatus Kentrum sp. TC TaxID=2126339 RepID=A0A450YYU6_9GAMM|nr:MAG: clan AA aspartic protease, AF_0612 family [Candidatus Kentron sp. TC]VFK46699.1 MAG: clan AA aspartic protease, AF_0612 family [Candidatus Kentron sp. TC]
MGITHVTTQVFDLARTNGPYEAEFLVDTGAMDCMAPGEKLERIGIRKERKSTYELANGETIEYDVGFARITFLGQETVAQIIFGPTGIEPILGVVVLENLGFVVDPGTNQLKKVAARPLK